MATDPIQFLKALALGGAKRDFIPITSRRLADEIGVSQQTASRKILELLDRGLIDRRLGARVQLVRLTDEGVEALRSRYEQYRAIFEQPDELLIRGRAESGLGEGKEFIQKSGYMTQIDERLGFKPYPGTFNLRVDERQRESLALLREESGIGIDSFTEGGRSYGAAKCFPARIEERPCAVILPERTEHSEVLEIISPEHLRSALAIDDGDIVQILVKLQQDGARNGG